MNGSASARMRACVWGAEVAESPFWALWATFLLLAGGCVAIASTFQVPYATRGGRRTALIAARQRRSTKFAHEYGFVLAQELLHGAMIPPALSGRVPGSLHKHPAAAVEHSGPCNRPGCSCAATGEVLMPQPFADQFRSIPMSSKLGESLERAHGFARDQGHRAVT